MTEKCEAARRAAPSPATDPSPSATTGTIPIWFATRSNDVVSVSPPGRLARPVVSIVLTEPPPPEPSISRMIGMRYSAAISSDIFGLALIDASAEPPRRVKSSPAITTGRPSTMPRPNTQLAGVKPTMSRLSASYVALPAMAPISWKLSGSSMRSMRSRTVSRPPLCWRSTRSGPPSSFARAMRRRSSSSSGSHPTAVGSVG